MQTPASGGTVTRGVLKIPWGAANQGTRTAQRTKQNMSAFADLADAATRSSVGHLFRQLLLATPKTRGLTMTLTRAGDLKFSSYPVQQPSRRAATQQQSRSSPKGGPPE